MFGSLLIRVSTVVAILSQAHVGLVQVETVGAETKSAETTVNSTTTRDQESEPRRREGESTKKVNLRSHYDTQVAIGPCVFSPGKEVAPLAAIGGILLAQAIANGVNRLGSALEEAGKEKTWQIVTSRNLEVNEDRFRRCIQIVRGLFYEDPTPHYTKKPAQPAAISMPAERAGADETAQPKSPAQPVVGSTGPQPPTEKSLPDEKIKAAASTWLDEGKVQILKDSMLWLAGSPDFFFEGQIARSLSGDVYTIIPRFTHFAKPIEDNWYRSSERHVLITLTFHSPGTPATEKTNPSTAVVLGRLSSGDEIDNWKAKIELADSPNRFPGEGPWFFLPLNKTTNSPSGGGSPGHSTPGPLAPLTLTVSITEKRDANEFLSFIASVFKDSSTEITNELQNKFVPAKREAAEEERKKGEEKAQNDFDTKYITALQKLKECAEASADHEQKALAARAAIRDLGQVARAAGTSYNSDNAEVQKIKIVGTPDEIKNGCIAAAQGLPKV